MTFPKRVAILAAVACFMTSPAFALEYLFRQPSPAGRSWSRAAFRHQGASPIFARLHRSIPTESDWGDLAVIAENAGIKLEEFKNAAPDLQKQSLHSAFESYVRAFSADQKDRSGHFAIFDRKQAQSLLVLNAALESSFAQEIGQIQEGIDQKLKQHLSSLEGLVRSGDWKALSDIYYLSYRMDLPAELLAAVAGYVGSNDAMRAGFAYKVLDSQSELPPIVIAELEQHLQGGPAELEPALDLILAADPAHQVALKAYERTALREDATWLELTARTIYSGEGYLLPPSIEQIERAAMLRNVGWPEHSYRSFLANFKEYTQDPRRFLKLIDKGDSAGIEDPKRAREADKIFRERLLRELKSQIPSALAEEEHKRWLTRHTAHVDPIVGVIVVGSIGKGQATADSDIDLVVVHTGLGALRDGGRFLGEQIVSRMRKHGIELKKADVVGQARMGSLRFKRYQARGGIFFPAKPSRVERITVQIPKI